jgi:hypothetical protein
MTATLDNYAFDPATLVSVFVDRDNYYSILRDQQAGVAVLEVVIPWIAYYSVYFWLSADELHLLESDKPAFDQLAHGFAMDKGERLYGYRLLLHQGPDGGRYRPSTPERAYAVDGK